MDRKKLYVCSICMIISVLFIGAWNQMPVRRWEQNELTSLIPGGGILKKENWVLKALSLSRPFFQLEKAVIQ